MAEQKSIEDYVKDYLNNNPLDYKGMWPEDIIIEVAGEVAEQILNEKHPNTKHFVEGKMFDLDCDYFTEQSQDLFNEYYDQVRQHLADKINQ